MCNDEFIKIYNKLINSNEWLVQFDFCTELTLVLLQYMTQTRVFFRAKYQIIQDFLWNDVKTKVNSWFDEANFFSNRLLPFVFKDTKFKEEEEEWMDDNNVTISGRNTSDTITLIKCQITSSLWLQIFYQHVLIQNNDCGLILAKMYT